MGITNWLKTHKPIDFKLFIIIGLIFMLLKRTLVWLSLVMVGIAAYPKQIDYKIIFEKAGNTIGVAYEKAMIQLYEAGFRIGEQWYPQNVILVRTIYFSISIAIIVFVVFIIVYFINVIMYKNKEVK